MHAVAMIGYLAQRHKAVYLSPHHLAPKGVDRSIGRASHRRCEVVGSILSQVPRFFSLEKDLGTCM